MPFPRPVLWLLAVGAIFQMTVSAPAEAQVVFINEIHYDNANADSGEGVEIAGPAGTNLSDYDLVLYNGATATAATTYATHPLTGIIPNQANGYGVLWFGFPTDGLQNGTSDGIVLYNRVSAQVIQFLSYEGVCTAANGPAAGLSSTDIGVSETNSTPVGHSLQLRGTGSAYGDFIWNAPSAHSAGLVNPGQTFTGAPPRTITLTIVPAAIAESAGPQASTATVTLHPAPNQATTISLVNPDPSEINLPASVSVPATGSVNFFIAAVMDGIVDGNQTVTVIARDPTSFYAEGTAVVTVNDVDSPPPVVFDGKLRLATINVLNGIGTSGSAEFTAVKEILLRLQPDVIAFQEVSDAFDFADLKALVGQLGFPTDRTHLATAGDAFVGQTFSSGDFGSGTQSIAVASRFPITSTVQISRGVAGRKEMTRFPLFVTLDVPGVPSTSDPAVVSVHLKASGKEADRFRRLIETYRIRQFLADQGWLEPGKNLFLLGDFNEQDEGGQTASFHTGINPATHVFSDGSKLIASYILGADLTGANAQTLAYATFPTSAFTQMNLQSPPTFHADGRSRRTFNSQGDARLDYIAASTTLIPGAVAEVYNSRLEHAFDGLPKLASLPHPDLSFTASDHFLVYGDFPLAAGQPRLILDGPATPLRECTDRSTQLSLSLSAPLGPGQEVTVNLSTFRSGRIRLMQSRATLTAAQPTAQIPVQILHPPQADPHRVVTVTASADGWCQAHARIEVRNFESAGRLLITQYLDPADNGGGPKAVELMNLSGALIDFAKTPLLVRKFVNGEAFGVTDAVAEIGILEPNQALVVGDAAVGEFLLAQGIIVPNMGVTPATAAAGTPFFNASGALRFQLDSLTYNGDDALEILLNHTREDVFGTIGQDPGVAWSGNGVSTADQNLELRPSIGTGSTGFTDPSRRFSTRATDDSLTGFGIPPVLNDPYLAWATSQGLVGPDSAPLADPDGDGALNFLEFALLGNPTVSGSLTPSPVIMNGAVRLSFQRRPASEGLRYRVEKSADLQSWTTAGVSLTSLEVLPNGTENATYTATPVPGATRLFVRLRAERD